MAVEIDIFDFKCFNQLTNGSTFLLNPLEFTPNLVGNIGERVKVEFKANIQQSSNTEASEEWFIENDPSVKEIVRSSGSFLEDGVQVGDVYGFFNDWENRKTTVAIFGEYVGQVEFISSDGRTLRYSVVSGTDSTNGNVTNVGLAFPQTDIGSGTIANLNTALFLKFGLISNEETFNFISKTTEAQQVYYVGELISGDPAKNAESLGVIKDWVSGVLTVEFTSNEPSFKGAQYVITHEFVLNPFYILSFRENLENGTIPDLLAGDSSIKYAAELEFRKALTNTGSSKIQSFAGLPGFVGWYGENFNGLNKKYVVSSITYEDALTLDPLDAININRETKATIVIDNPDAAITDYNVGVYLFRLPTSEDEYIGTETNLLVNFIRLSETITSPATTSPNVTTSLVAGNLVIEYDISYLTADRLRLSTDDEYILAVQVEDPTISAGNSDRVMLIADLNNYVDIDFVSQFVNVSKYRYLQHGQAIGDDGALTPVTSNEDGVILDATFGLDVTKDAVVNSITARLIAYNPSTGASFELDLYDFNIGAPIINAGIQEIEIDTTRGYPLPPGDEFNLVRITTGTQVGDFQEYNLFLGQKIKWQEWLLNAGVDNVFFDATEPNNNLNFKSSNYSNEQGYFIRLALVINVSGTDDLGRTVTGDFINFGNSIEVNDYDESADSVNGVIQTFDVETGNSLEGNILYNGKDTLFRAVFQNAATMQYGIHRIEPSQNPGDGILELSSLLPSVSNNLLKPVDGETLLKFDLVGSELTTECLIDGSLLQENTQYKLSARVGTIPISLGVPFTFTINTANAGDSSNTEFTLPITGGYNILVDKGNGDALEAYSGVANPVLDYSGTGAGVYTVQIFGTLINWGFENLGDPLKLTQISQWGDAFQFTERSAFYGCASLSISAVDIPTISTADMANTFRDCSAITSIPTLNDWDMSGVTDIGRMFNNCAVFNQDLDNWNTGAVTTMFFLFEGCSLFNGNIDNWNISNCLSLESTFEGCTSFDRDISYKPGLGIGGGDAWNVGSVTSLQDTFFGCSSFDQNINSWDVANVTTMNSTFRNCSSFNQPLNSWVTSSLTILTRTFTGASSFNQDLDNWDVSGVTSMFFTFQSCTAFNGNIDNWDVSSVGSMANCFQSCPNFNRNLNGWVTSSLTNASSLFRNCTSFDQPLSGWDMSGVTTIANMFRGATSFNQNINGWVTSNVTSMALTFFGASSFNQPLNGWNVSAVQSMLEMFGGATQFNQDLNSWVTTACTNMGGIFDSCINFNGNVSSWDVSNVVAMNSMFRGCPNFNQNLSGWNPSSATTFSNMFFNCTSFDQDLGLWDIQSLTTAVDMFQGVTLSTVNYDALLVGWEANVHNNGVVFDGGNSSYSLGSPAETARTNLIGDGWTITDAGGV